MHGFFWLLGWGFQGTNEETGEASTHFKLPTLLLQFALACPGSFEVYVPQPLQRRKHMHSPTACLKKFAALLPALTGKNLARGGFHTMLPCCMRSTATDGVEDVRMMRDAVFVHTRKDTLCHGLGIGSPMKTK